MGAEAYYNPYPVNLCDTSKAIRVNPTWNFNMVKAKRKAKRTVNIAANTIDKKAGIKRKRLPRKLKKQGVRFLF